MKILYVHHTDVIGGAELSISELLAELVKRGVEPVTLLPSGPLSKRFENIGAKVINVPIPKVKRTLNPMKLASYFASRMKLSTMAKEIVEQENIDLVHFNSLSAAVLFGDGITSKAPAVLHLRDSIIPKTAFGTMASNLTAYVAISSYMNTVLTEYLEVPEYKVFEITNGLCFPQCPEESQKLAARKDLGIPEDAVVFLCASAFVPWKNHKSAMDAFKRVRKSIPNAMLILCGKDVSGQNNVLVKKILATASLFGEQCLTPGFVKNMDKYYRASDVFVHPAIGEPFGRAVVEAQACGLPVVAFRSGSMEEVIEDGKSGIIADLKASLFAEAMQELGLNAKLRNTMGEYAAKRAREIFSVETCADRTHEFYQKLLNGGFPVIPPSDPIPQKKLRRQRRILKESGKE